MRQWLVTLVAAGGMAGPAAAHAQAPAVASPPWQLVWADEFDAPRIDPARWTYDIDCWGGGNDERQCYTDRPQNAAIKDGKLVITARRERASGFALPRHMRATAREPGAVVQKNFTSARLVTRGRAAWRYGKIEARAKLPQGQGVWPAIWMMPEDNVYGGWPLSGEIDILEAINLGTPCATCVGGVETRVFGTLHFGNAPPGNKQTGSERNLPSVRTEFHTYGVIWSPGRIVWTIDGVPYATKTSADWFTAATSDPLAPFDQRFHLILNLAIGGRWPEGSGLGGVSGRGFPKRMEIDWVRVWQCGADASQPGSCVDAGAKSGN